MNPWACSFFLNNILRKIRDSSCLRVLLKAVGQVLSNSFSLLCYLHYIYTSPQLALLPFTFGCRISYLPHHSSPLLLMYFISPLIYLESVDSIAVRALLISWLHSNSLGTNIYLRQCHYVGINSKIKGNGLRKWRIKEGVIHRDDTMSHLEHFENPFSPATFSNPQQQLLKTKVYNPIHSYINYHSLKKPYLLLNTFLNNMQSYLLSYQELWINTHREYLYSFKLKAKNIQANIKPAQNI